MRSTKTIIFLGLLLSFVSNSYAQKYYFHRLIKAGTSSIEAVDYCDYSGNNFQGMKFNIWGEAPLNKGEIYIINFEGVDTYFYVNHTSLNASDDADETLGPNTFISLTDVCNSGPTYKYHQLKFLGNTQVQTARYCNDSSDNWDVEANILIENSLSIGTTYPISINNQIEYYKVIATSNNTDNGVTNNIDGNSIGLPINICQVESYKYHRLKYLGTTTNEAVAGCVPSSDWTTKANIWLERPLSSSKIYKINNTYYKVITSTYNRGLDVDENFNAQTSIEGPLNICTYTTTLDIDENYALSISPQIPLNDTELDDILRNSDSENQNDIIKNINYLDGLGRTKQTINMNAGGQRQDLVNHITYDQYGRQSKKYRILPISADNAGLLLTGDIETLNKQYYKNKYPTDFVNVPTAEVNSYVEQIFQSNPLNRVIETAAPGSAWGSNNNVTNNENHTIKYEYDTNITNEVVYFKVSFSNDNINLPRLVKVGYYPANQLYVKVQKNENWSSTQEFINDNTIKEYSNKLGKIVLKRAYNKGVVHDTHYVYDNFGNLTFVIPPKVDTTNDISNTELSELCYQYKYDSRNRIIEKKIPGKGWEYIVYNKLDLPIMSQDSNQKENNQWLFIVYDKYKRVAYTGIDENNTSDRETIQIEADRTIKQFVTKTDIVNTYNNTAIYYTKDAYPDSFDKILTINYYDDYEVGNIVTFNPANGSTTWEGMTASTMVKGLPTVSQVLVLGTDHWINTATYYDEKGRPWESHVKNTYLGTEDWVLNKLDFTGNVIKTRSIHQKNNNPEIVTLDIYTYDHNNRLLTHKQCVGNGSLPNDCGEGGSAIQENAVFSESITSTVHEFASKSITLSSGFHVLATESTVFSASIQESSGELITANTYDEIGQLTSKKVGNTKNNPLQEIDYTYNVRGWLKGINDVNTLGNDLFAFGINYNTTTENLQADALYNGNISETIWKTINDNTKRAYGYQYDPLNRITEAKGNVFHYDLSNVDYDKNGNIRTLLRDGHINDNATDFGPMDDLVYEYDSGNRLLKVTDYENNQGFKDGNTSGNDYEYDSNGNMTVDRNKGISDITYNFMNLPEMISIVSRRESGNISYIYDATGIKQKKIVSDGSSMTETEYAGNYVYKNGKLQFFNHPEGYVECENDGIYSFVYQYRDHLGNIRLSYSDRDKDGKVDVLRNTTDVDGDGDLAIEIIEEKNYYPFGLEHKGYNNTITGRKHNYGYQGQETEEELGKNTIAFQWRDYDPSIARFNKIDRFAEKYNSHSPYAFTKNNPIRFREIAGDSLWISFGKDNGNRALYQDGKLLNADGSRYEGKGVKIKKDGSVKITNSFLKKAVGALKEISQAETETGTDVVSTLQSSENNFTIQRGGNRFSVNQPGQSPNININDAEANVGQILGKGPVGDGPPSSTIGTGGIIYWNPDSRPSYITQGGGTGTSNTSILLGHELYHAYDSNNGNLDPRILPGGTVRMEGRAVYFGNQLRNTTTFGNRALRSRYGSGGANLLPGGNPLYIAPPSIELQKN